MFTPVEQPTDGQLLDVDTRPYNALLRGLQCLGERGFAMMTGRRRALRHFTTSPRKIGHIVKAALVLTHFRTQPTHPKLVEITSMESGTFC